MARSTLLLALALAVLAASAAPAAAYPKREPPRQPNKITGSSSSSSSGSKNAAAAVNKPSNNNNNKSASTTLDCAAVLHDAAKACASELKLVDSKAKVASASSTCCAAAAKIYSPAFASACACQPNVLREAARLTAARTAVQAACPALKTAAVAIPACATARNGTTTTPAAPAAPLPGAPPRWGTGSICYSQDSPSTSANACATKCTRTSTPTQAQINSAKNCASNQKGFCEGLGVDGAVTGISRCDAGAPVPDPNGQGRTCFQCCTVRLQPTGTATKGKNACKRPSSGGGGGGGGGGGCFPGSSTVVLEGGSSIALRDLKIGDRVLSADPATGALSFHDVYFFGHMAERATSEFVKLEVDNGAMELSRKHLLPVMPGPVYKRAQDVVVGDVVLVVDSLTQQAREAKVATKTSVVRSSGLYAPVTLGGGHIVVSSASESSSSAAVGVVASVHSDWILDPLFEKLGKVSSLHSAYERTHGALLRLVYRLVGPAPLQAIAPVVSALANGEMPAGAVSAARALAATTTAASSRKA